MISGNINSRINLPALASMNLALLSALPFTSLNAQKIPDSKPNVIFIILDDMGVVDGADNFKMPNIDQLRKSAVTFSRANCPAPLSMPSRASFFTGIYPHNSGAYSNGNDPWNRSEVLKQAETLPELFRRNGYYTFGRGKIYHAKMEAGRIERNFDNRPIYEGGFGPFPDKEHRVFSPDDKFPEFWGVQAFPDSAFPDVRNADAVIDFLHQDHNKPFFIAYGLYRPHTPFTAPQRFFDMYDSSAIEIPKGYLANDLDDVPEYGRNLLDPFGRFKITGADNVDRWKHFIHGYYACTSFADWNVGRVTDALSKSRYASNTIVVVLGDNGFHLGVKNHWEKNTLWNESTMVPLMIRVPDSPSNGTVAQSPVGLIDLYPTIVDLCKLKPPSHRMDGQSLRPFFEKRGYSWNRPALTTFGENLVSLQNDRYRYIQYPDGSAELYDYLQDPYEWKNLIKDKKLVSVVDEFKKSIPASFMKELQGGRKN